MEASQSDDSFTSLTRAYNDSNSLIIRLDTDPELQRFELLLKGLRPETFQDPNTQMYVTKYIPDGLPKANSRGIMEIYNWVSSIINKAMVQGNFPITEHGYSEAYENFQFWFRVDFGTFLLNNYYEFGLQESALQGLIDQACLMVYTFTSRLIGNEERKSMSQTLKQVDSTRLHERERGFRLFGNNKQAS